MDETLYHKFLDVERTHWWFRARRDILNELVKRYVPEGGQVLDLGCGTGYFLEGLAPRYEAWGVDFSPLAVRMSQERGLANVRVGTTEDLSAVNGRRYDLVCLLDVIEHLDDDLGALKKARAVLKPGGRVLVTVPAYRWMWSKHDELNHHRRRYNRGELGRVLTDAGFTLERLTYFNCHLFPLAWAVRTWRRLTGDSGENEFALPGRLLNESLRRVFLAERGFLAAGGRYPFGLSVLALGRSGPAQPE